MDESKVRRLTVAVIAFVGSILAVVGLDAEKAKLIIAALDSLAGLLILAWTFRSPGASK